MGGQLQLPQNIIVYVRPNCPECNEALRYLENRSLPFRVRDVVRDDDAQEDLDALGYTESDLPVIFLDDQVVTGFDVNRLDAYLVHITV